MSGACTEAAGKQRAISGNLVLSSFYTVSQKLWVFALIAAKAQKFVLK